MSKAKELAWYCGATFDEEAKLFVFDEEEIKDFYHKSRSDVMMEIAARLDSGNMNSQEPEWSNGYSAAEKDIANGLRAMADREGKE